MNNKFSHIDLDLSTKCNLRCRFCHLSWYKPQSWVQLTLAQFLKLVPSLNGIKSLTLFSKYEILTCKDFIPIFQEIKKLGISETYFSTNGILLNKSIINEIVDSLTYLTISVTGFTNNDYLKNMNYDGLDKVIENINLLNEVKNKRKSIYPKLRISMVGMQDNLDQLIPGIDFCKKLSADEGIQITYFNSHDNKMNHLTPLFDMNNFTNKINEAREYAIKLNVKFDLQGGFPEEIDNSLSIGTNHKECRIPWQRLSLQPDGEVYPCPTAYTSIGNFFETKLEDIWNGKKLEIFRLGVNDPSNLNPECANCSYCKVKSPTTNSGNLLGNKKVLWAGMKRIDTKD